MKITLTYEQFGEYTNEIISEDNSMMQQVDLWYYSSYLTREQYVLYMHYLTRMYVESCSFDDHVEGDKTHLWCMAEDDKIDNWIKTGELE